MRSDPQYTGLEHLQKQYADRGFTVLGVPCNQFAGQEPGTPEEIETFCSTTYGVTFPITEKVDVNGQKRHPLYQQLTDTPDADGNAGDIQWNFEKFLVGPDGRSSAGSGRRRPRVGRGHRGHRSGRPEVVGPDGPGRRHRPDRR